AFSQDIRYPIHEKDLPKSQWKDMPKTAIVIFVSGQVQRPGSIVMENPMRISEAIAVAGGFLDGKAKTIRLVRWYGEGLDRRNYEYSWPVADRAGYENLLVQAADIINVRP